MHLVKREGHDGLPPYQMHLCQKVEDCTITGKRSRGRNGCRGRSVRRARQARNTGLLRRNSGSPGSNGSGRTRNAMRSSCRKSFQMRKAPDWSHFRNWSRGGNAFHAVLAKKAGEGGTPPCWCIVAGFFIPNKKADFQICPNTQGAPVR